MFSLFTKFFYWVYPNTSLGGLTGEMSLEDPEEETKYEFEEYDHLYEEPI